jgi:hypothetical protein
VSLYNTAHPTGVGGTYQNQLSVAQDLNEASLEQAIIDIHNLVDDAGIRILVRPKSLIVHRNDLFNACRLLDTELRVATANNDINALKSKGYFTEGAKLNIFLTSSIAWFIINELTAKNGLLHFTREGYTLESEQDFMTKNALFTVDERYCFGWTDPRGTYASAGV